MYSRESSWPAAVATGGAPVADVAIIETVNRHEGGGAAGIVARHALINGRSGTLNVPNPPLIKLVPHHDLWTGNQAG
ncbi:hypothetical protein [Amycolatopsis regifaucium]|nr:hypothetical protein [Amycolatopsis regifaucium]SFH01135.1 hypothetical protein SAMN04489731_10250 [Amycolatopsis regifaucium]